MPSTSDESSNLLKIKRTELPRIFDGMYYHEISEHPNDKIWAKCTNCDKIVKGNKTSTGNFKNHYRTNHPTLTKELDSYLNKKQTWEPIVKPIQTHIFAPEVRKEGVIF